MFWFRSKLRSATALISSMMLITCWTACKPDLNETGVSLKYFDLKGYFSNDAAGLNRLNKPVLKTVTHNGITETKKVLINNWDRELDLFIGSDINRPAWKKSYKVIAANELTVYKAKYPELKMREMRIKMDKQKVKWIQIFNSTKNILYQTTEKLCYFPDSLYTIEKVQKVLLMGTNVYRINGVISK